MYYPILRGKRHELSAIVELASLPASRKCRPLIEPVNSNLNDLVACIENLHGKGVIPYVIVNPNLGDFAGVGALVLPALQSNPRSASKFIPCVKILNAFDVASINTLQNIPGAAAYLVSDISPAVLPLLNNANCVFANPLKVDGSVLRNLNRLVVYQDSFARQRRNADYPNFSFFSNLHFNYAAAYNAIGVGDFTVMGEEYSEAGGPAHVVAIHMSYLQRQPVSSIYVMHFCSTMQSATPANPGGKFIEALGYLTGFHALNPNVFDNTWGLAQFHAYYANQHYPGLGVAKELSVEHHMETVCNFI